MDTRKTINGLRHYKCPGVPDYLPSVTSILSSTQSAKTQQKLAHWNIMNPGAADAAAARGTWIHEATENHIRGLKVVPPEAYAPFGKVFQKEWMKFLKEEESYGLKDLTTNQAGLNM